MFLEHKKIRFKTSKRTMLYIRNFTEQNFLKDIDFLAKPRSDVSSLNFKLLVYLIWFL